MKKIKNITTTLKSIPLDKPFITALRRVDEVRFVRVSIAFDDGSLSYGEAPATKAITGEDLDDIVASVLDVSPLLQGLHVSDAFSVLHQQNIGTSAKAALDMALYFALYSFEIKSDVKEVETDITISYNKTEVMLQDAKEAYAKGFSHLKIKFADDIEHAVSTTIQLRALLPDTTLLIDANQAWSLEESLTYIEGTKGLDLALIEQPIEAKQRDELKMITEFSSVPILADEAVFSLEDVKYVVENQCADMINIKLMKCGGITKGIEILEYARKHNVSCMLGSMLEGPLSINAALYLAFEYSDVIAFIDLDSPSLYKEPSDELKFLFQGAKITPHV